MRDADLGALPLLSEEEWIRNPEMIGLEFLWPSRIHGSPHPSTRQYARIVRGWVMSLDLEPSAYGTHSMRRTKVAQIYKKRVTCGLFNCCSATRRWTALCAISGSISKTR